LIFKNKNDARSFPKRKNKPNKKESKVRWLAQAYTLKNPKDYGIMKGK